MSCACMRVFVLLTSFLWVSAQQPLRVYVYDLPRHLSEDVLAKKYQQSWLQNGSYEYEADLWVYKRMVDGPFRVHDPAEANFFYIPVLPTRFLHQTLSTTIVWQQSINLTSEYLREALTFVQQQPYWKKHNGRDHFFTVTTDSARCAHLSKLPKSLWGDLRLVMHLGDTVLRENGFACYHPDSDILLPAFNPVEIEALSDVWGQERNVTLLYRFRTTGPTALRPYFSKLIRPELYTEYEANPLPGSDWNVKSKVETMVDMAHSLFCVCPPGIVAHTSRFWRSIRRGCIPVTFFKAYDLPFSDTIDYSKASVNIAPDKIHTLHDTLAAILHDKERIKQYQVAIKHLQRQLVWEGDDGIWPLFKNELLKQNQTIIEV